MYKILVVASIILIISLVNGEQDPNSEVESVTLTNTHINELKNILKKYEDEANKLREFLDSTKNNKADGQSSSANIDKLLNMPKEIADLATKIQSKINALKKES